MTLSIGRRGLLALAFGLAALLAGSFGAAAQELPPFTAKAGMLNIGADPERPEAEIFHIAYTLDGADPATRPVTFLWNGGPGGASIFLHIAAIGPKTIATAGNGTFPAVPARLETHRPGRNRLQPHSSRTGRRPARPDTLLQHDGRPRLHRPVHPAVADGQRPLGLAQGDRR
ncbi:MAG: hypothetical protein MUF63_01010 [Rhodobacteraceae bacterium]|nr:hypothetical protein [Paracoccaceae bacterium]